MAAPRAPAARRALIYGAGDGGVLTLRELRSNIGLGRHAVGFLDDDRDKRGARIHGLPVLGGLDGRRMSVRQSGSVKSSSRHGRFLASAWSAWRRCARPAGSW